MTKVYLLTAFGGDYEDEWENVEGAFSSYAAMTTWINGKFEQIESEFMSNVLPEVPVIDGVYFSGSFKCLEHNEVVGLRYKAYDVIGEVDCKTDKIVFKEDQMSIKDVKTDNYHLMFGDCLERMREIPD